jgi:predicted lipoprotein with Yx(FWY)xxD motif
LASGRIKGAVRVIFARAELAIHKPNKEHPRNMSTVRKLFSPVMLIAVFAALALVAAGCGDDNDDAAAPASAAAATEAGADDDGAMADHAPADPETLKEQEITLQLGDSDFGEILTDQRDRTMYLFEPDKGGESTCYGECAEIWPPVLVNEAPRAADGLGAELGTTERRDGKLQATYNGHPLYYMVGEKPGVVMCQAKDMNGGFWYVLDAKGEAITKAE